MGPWRGAEAAAWLVGRGPVRHVIVLKELVMTAHGEPPGRVTLTESAGTPGAREGKPRPRSVSSVPPAAAGMGTRTHTQKIWLCSAFAGAAAVTPSWQSGRADLACCPGGGSEPRASPPPPPTRTCRRAGRGAYGGDLWVDLELAGRAIQVVAVRGRQRQGLTCRTRPEGAGKQHAGAQGIMQLG